MMASFVKELIVSGALSTETVLWSIRPPSESLRVSAIATRRVYRGLEPEGRIRSEQGRGTFVAAHDEKDGRSTARRLPGKRAAKRSAKPAAWPCGSAEVGTFTEGLRRAEVSEVRRGPEPVLVLENVCKRYPHFSLGPLDAALELAPGTVTTLVGRNGSGKSLLLNMLVNWIKPTEGKIRLFGWTYPEGEVAIKSRLAYMPDLPELFYGATGSALVRQAKMLAPDWDDGRFRELAKRFELPNLDLPFETLSKGQRERLLLALVLSRTVPLYVLDEPTSGLDPYVRALLYDAWRERLEAGAALFLSSHDMAAVERFADVIVVMHAGRLLGPYVKDELLDRWALIAPEVGEGALTGRTPAGAPIEGTPAGAPIAEETLRRLPGVVAVTSSPARSIISRDRETTEAALRALGHGARSARLPLTDIVRYLMESEGAAFEAASSISTNGRDLG
ncbi:hypothetical protein SA87_08950 [Hydrogenibacillus schlegelii]|uniref:ABC transporter domain-containing protein n=1 Tax=Hydrogenibacillus schlegelii TaxID=1484 RepID=A0A179ISF7_HYDSH|nr:hypothetical protein SA87_08950 [Hydrogenibacillus schlegelii]